MLQRSYVQIALLVALCAVVYGNSLGNGFHLDDFYRVNGNPQLTRLSPIGRFFSDPSTMSTQPRLTQYRPLLPLSLAIDHAIAGRHSVVAYHVTNLLWLMLGAALCYALALRLLERTKAAADLPEPTRRGVAWAVAALFAVHPVAGIAVNYICARDLLMMQALLLLSLWAYLGVDTRGSSRRRVALWALSLLALVASLLSKQNAVVMPALVLAVEVLANGQRLTTLRPWRRVAPFALVVAGFFVLTEVALGFSDLRNVTATSTTRLTYAMTQLKLHVFHYLKNAAFPWTIRMDPAVTPASALDAGVIVGALGIVATLVLAWRWRRRSPLAALCIVCYWVLLAPTSSLQPFHHLAVDYRPFPSQLFLWLALAAALAPRLSSRTRRVVVAAALAYFSIASVLHNRSWRDDKTLWRRSVRYGGGALAHHNLAVALEGDDTLDERIRLLRQALKMQPKYILAHLNLCQALVHKRQVKLGLASCATALRLGPNDAQAHFLTGYTYYRLRDRARTAWFYQRAAALNPQSSLYQYRAGRALQMVGKEAASLPFLQRAWAVNPRHKDTGYLLGWAYQKLGKREASIAVYTRFVAFAPRHVQARFNLAFALMKSRRYRAAVPHFRAVLALKPSYREARLSLQHCLVRGGPRGR